MIILKRKILTVFITLMVCLTAIVIIPNKKNIVTAQESEQQSMPDINVIKSVTENLSNVIYNAYEEGEIQKGRAFGTKGEHYAADYLYDVIVSLLTNI